MVISFPPLIAKFPVESKHNDVIAPLCSLIVLITLSVSTSYKIIVLSNPPDITLEDVESISTA